MKTICSNHTIKLIKEFKTVPALGLVNGLSCKAAVSQEKNYTLASHLYIFGKSIIMTTQEIAARLTQLCRKGEWETAQKELYANDAISIEPHANPVSEKETKGLPAILEKGHKFQEMIEEKHGLTISEPLIAANSIAFNLNMDITMKGGKREKMGELCVYQVKDGKIVSEQFFM
jgi:hypothetical protein